MKKRISLALCLCVLLCFWIPESIPVSAEVTGNGTGLSPYKIPITKDLAIGRSTNKRAEAGNAGAYMAMQGYLGDGNAYALLELDLNLIPEDASPDSMTVQFIFQTANMSGGVADIYLTNDSWDKGTISAVDIDDKITNGSCVYATQISHVRYLASGSPTGLTRIAISDFATPDMLDKNEHDTLTLVYKFSATSTIIYYFGSEFTGTNADARIHYMPPYVSIIKHSNGDGTEQNPHVLYARESQMLSDASVNQEGFFKHYIISSAGNHYAIFKVDIADLYAATGPMLAYYDIKTNFIATSNGGTNRSGAIYVTDAEWTPSLNLTDIQGLVAASSDTEILWTESQWAAAGYGQTVNLGDALTKLDLSKGSISIILKYDSRNGAQFYGHNATAVYVMENDYYPKIILTAPVYNWEFDKEAGGDASSLADVAGGQLTIKRTIPISDSNIYFVAGLYNKTTHLLHSAKIEEFTPSAVPVEKTARISIPADSGSYYLKVFMVSGDFKSLLPLNADIGTLE